MFTVDWENIKEDDLKDTDYLVKEFRKYLKRECHYSAEAAKFAADVIREPFAKNYCACEREYVSTIEINSKTYEVFYCYAEDSAPNPFEFYTLVDVDTKSKKTYGDKLWPYIIAIKKYILPNK